MPPSVCPDTASARRFAHEAALTMLAELRPKRLPIDASQLARQWEIPVIARTYTSPDTLGALEDLGNGRYRIGVARQSAPIQQMFTVAHELGHFCMNDHSTVLHPIPGLWHRSLLELGAADSYDYQADFFADALLVPTQLCRGLVDRLDAEHHGLHSVQTLAATCRVPLVSAARRYPEMTQRAAATVLSRGGRIIDALLSRTLCKRLGCASGSLLHGRRLPACTPRPKHVKRIRAHTHTRWTTQRDVSWDSWFSGLCGLTEETCHWAGRHDALLTILVESKP